MKKIAFVAMILCSQVSYSYAAPASIEDVEQEDQFLADLMRASEDDTQEDDELSGALQLLDDVDQRKHEIPEEPSLLRKYATIAALKAILWYGRCKQYVKQWAVYLSSYVWS